MAPRLLTPIPNLLKKTKSSITSIIFATVLMNLLVIKNLLKKTGVKLDITLSGQDSVALARKNDYDMILMDQRMPGMDGTEAMKEIRKFEAEKGKKTPIICLTADVIRGAKERYLELGFDDYLTKPVDGTELEMMIMKYLPDEKIDLSVPEETVEESDSEEEWVTKLRKADIDVETGLSYCGEDLEIYQTILEAYVDEAKTKTENIINSYAAQDWKNYGVYVHALKSTSKTIGAMELSELAATLEAAAKSEDIDVIRKNHDMALQMYGEVVANLEDILKK